MRPDWIIHYILCDRPSSHTHGLDKYGSLELELNLPVSDKKATEVLNLVGEAIAEKGRRYRSGDYEDGIFTLPFYLFETESAVPGSVSNRVLRILVCDPDGKYPWEAGCDPDYAAQLNDSVVKRRFCPSERKNDSASLFRAVILRRSP